MENLIAQIEKTFSISDVRKQRENLYYITASKDQTIPLITWLRDFKGFKHFVLLTAVDWIEDNKFQLTYTLNNPDEHYDIGIRTFIDRDNPVMISAHHLWEQVATYQREIKEMYGIDFPGSPRVDEPFILEGWDNIPPMRRDFDTLKYSEETYFPRPGRKTYNPTDYMKEKLYTDSNNSKQDK
ncbi:MAG: NADH-quinone oxidoreductase subunit C [Marinilabiliales bacterium]